MHSFRSAALLCPLVLCAFIGTARAQVAAQSKPTRDAGDALSKPVGAASASTLGSVNSTLFVQNAARSDMYEISAGKLAEGRASSPQIKAFAKQMVQAHTKTSASLKTALGKSGVKVAIPSQLDARRQGLLDNLRASPADEFEKRYVAQQVASHQEALDLMQGFAERGDNAVLKVAAAKTAPLVAEHLKMAKMLPGAGG